MLQLVEGLEYDRLVAPADAKVLCERYGKLFVGPSLGVGKVAREVVDALEKVVAGIPVSVSEKFRAIGDVFFGENEYHVGLRGNDGGYHGYYHGRSDSKPKNVLELLLSEEHIGREMSGTEIRSAVGDISEESINAARNQLNRFSSVFCASRRRRKGTYFYKVEITEDVKTPDSPDSVGNIGVVSDGVFGQLFRGTRYQISDKNVRDIVRLFRDECLFPRFGTSDIADKLYGGLKGVLSH